MKKKIVALLLTMCLGVSLVGCGAQTASDNGSSIAATSKDASGEESASNETEAEEDLQIDFSGNYLWVDTKYGIDEMDYTQMEQIFAGPEGTFSFKGYAACTNIINGVALAHIAEDKAGIISKDGEMLVPIGTYDCLTRVGEVEVRNYFVGKDTSTGKYGVIDAVGTEIVPFQYEEIKVTESSKDSGGSVCFYLCKNGNSYDFIAEDGKVMLEGCSSGDIAKAHLYEDEQGNCMFSVMVAGETYFFCEGVEGYLPKPEDYDSEWTYRGETMFSYTAKDGSKKMVSFSDDWKTMTPLNVSIGTCIKLGDNLLVHKGYYGISVYDKEGNEVQSTGLNLYVAQGYGGKVGYYLKDINFFNEKSPTIYNDKFEEVIELANCEELTVAGGWLYARPTEGTDGTHDLYDLDGKLLYKNITMIEYDKEFVEFMREDGVFVRKTIDMPEAICAEEDELFYETSSSSYCFINGEGKYVFKDKNLNYIATFDEMMEYKGSYEMFYRDGKYYNLQGELIYEWK